MSMAKEQWDAVEKSLRGPWGFAKLNCDGFELYLSKQQHSESKLAIMVYVNGKFKGSWCLEDCEERRRFFRPKERFLFPDKARKGLIKAFGKRKAEAQGFLKKHTSFYPYWTSFKPLKAHLRANNQSIQLVECSATGLANG